MKYTAGKAAEAAGLAKSTITKAISSGKLSAVKNANGAWEIDAAELHRVFPPKQSETVSIEQTATPAENGSVAKFDCIFALGQCCAILFSKKPKAGTIHDD